MSEKDTKRALAEQRRRQKELIELKRLRQEGGSLPNETEHEVLTTPTQKVKHFWYYYKYYVLAAIILIPIFVFLVGQCSSNIKYDYTIIFNSTEYVTEEDLDILKAEFTRLADDRNKDGEVNVIIINCSRDTDQIGNVEFNKNQYDRFQTQVYDNVAKIFIVDKAIFEECNQSNYMLWTDNFNLPEFEGKAFAMKNTQFADVFKNYKNEYFIGYRLSDSYETGDAALFLSFIEANILSNDTTN